jgi:hypothetical protein
MTSWRDRRLPEILHRFCSQTSIPKQQAAEKRSLKEKGIPFAFFLSSLTVNFSASS